MPGGSNVFFLGCYCYIADISKPEDVTIRIAIMDGLFHIGFYVGNAFAGPIKKNLGLPYNFALGILFTCISASYTLIRIKESLVPLQKQEQKREEHLETEEGNKRIIVIIPSFAERYLSTELFNSSIN